MKNFEQIVAKYGLTKEDVENDICFDNDSLMDDLYDIWYSEMPYGTAKARDGDPQQWIYDRLCSEFGI